MKCICFQYSLHLCVSLKILFGANKNYTEKEQDYIKTKSKFETNVYLDLRQIYYFFGCT